MDYAKQLIAYYRVLPNNPLSSNAQCLYSYLLNYNNGLFWIKEFTVTNSIIMGFTSLSRMALDRARNELKTKGYIDYKKGTGNQAGTYSIVCFVTQDDTQSVIQDITQNVTQDDTQYGNINKLNKTKQKNNKEKNNKKKYGEYGNVLLDDEQYQKLLNEFPNDYKDRIQRLDDYVQSKGKKYKDYLATIRTWARKEGYKKPEKEAEYKEIRADELTEEEYIKLVRGGQDV